MKMPIKSGKVFCRSVSDLISWLEPVEFSQPVEVTIKPFKDKRSLNQNNLFHEWCNVLSRYLISRGRYDWTFDKTKYNLKATFLGCNEVEQVNMKTGHKSVTYEPKHTSDLSVGDMHFFMDQVYQWCLMELGLALPIPEDSEYKNLRDSQNE